MEPDRRKVAWADIDRDVNRIEDDLNQIRSHEIPRKDFDDVIRDLEDNVTDIRKKYPRTY